MGAVATFPPERAARRVPSKRRPAARGGSSGRGRSERRDLAWFVLFELAFVVAYRLGMSFTQSPAVPLWFPDAVLLCALLVSPPRRWAWYVLGAAPIRFLLFVPPGTPFWFLIACWANDSLKGLLSAWLLRRISRPALWMDDVGRFAKYFLVAVCFSPALSALAGAITRVQLGDEFGRALRNWFLGDALASLVLTPLLVTLATDYRGLAQVSRVRLAWTSFVFAGLAVSGYLAFHGGLSNGVYPPFLLYVPVPFLLAASVAFGLTGASAALLLLSLVAIYGTLAGRGPFQVESAAASLLSIQLFLFSLSVPFMFLSVLIDQQRQTDRALRESERRFRSLVDAAPVLVWMAGRDGFCTFVNQPWLDFTGRALSEELGKGRALNIHVGDRERYASAYKRAFEARSKLTAEYRLLRKDGTYRWLLESGIPRYAPDETFLGYVGSCIDITDRKDSEDRVRHMSAQLMHAQETERLRIGQELHDDLSQRAAALAFGLAYLARNCEADISAEFDELQMQAADLCNGIRNVSHQLRPPILENSGLAAALRDLCRRSSGDAQHVVLSGDAEPRALGDGASIALYRIAQEAIQNARRHSGAARVEIDLRATETAVRLSVKDTGRGFVVGPDAGSGLGLPGMEERVRNVGGSLNILSSPGSGTTIVATVPRSRSS